MLGFMVRIRVRLGLGLNARALYNFFQQLSYIHKVSVRVGLGL